MRHLGPLDRRLVAIGSALALITAACGGSAGTPGADGGNPGASAGGSAGASVGASAGGSAGASAGESAGPSADGSAASPAGSATAVPQPSPASSLAGGGPDIATTIQPPATGGALTVWNHFTGPDGSYFAALVERFNEETPQCQTTVQTAPGAEFVARLEAASIASQLPHVLAGGYDTVPLLAEDGILTPIDDLAEQAGFGPDQFPEAIWNAGVWKDARYAIPLDTHPMVFFYNRALFQDAGLDPDAPPTDQASFEEAITAISENTEADGYEMVGSGPGANFLAGLQFATLMYQGGGEWTNEDYSQATFNSEAGVQAAAFLGHLVTDLGVPVVESDQEIIAFAQGTNGMVWSGIWEATRYREALGDDLGVAPVPEIFGSGVWGGSHQMTVTSAASDPEIRGCAYYFIDWFSANSYNWAEGGQVPARNEVRQAILDASDPEGTLAIIQQVAPMAEVVRFLPTIPGGGDLLFVAQGAGEAATLVINGTATAQEALDTAATFNTQVLAQNKQRYGF